MPTYKTKRKHYFKHILTGMLCLCLFIALLAFGDRTQKSNKECLIFCLTSLVPSLFPVMCVSSILSESSACKLLGRMLYPFCKKLFGLSENGAYVFGVGIMCGFPVGSQNGYALYKKGLISKDELDCLLIISSIPSSAFVISAIGINMFCDKKIGICIYICAILSVILTGIIYRWVYLGKSNFLCQVCDNQKKFISVKAVCSAIQSSAVNMLYICGFVVFFNLLCEMFKLLSQKLNLPNLAIVTVNGLLELSSGARHAQSFPLPLSLLLCALFVGWSGISVHLQIFSVCRDFKISYFKYFLWRGALALICGITCMLAFYFGFV